MRKVKTILWACMLMLVNTVMYAQQDTVYAQQDTVAQEDYVYLLNSDVISFNQYLNPDAQILMGNVIFRHDSMYMYCDSAVFFQEANSFNAYHNVRAEQGDTLFLYGDSLYYDGNTKLLRVRDNVRLENRTMVLLTDSLNYDRNTNLGWFFDGGTLLDEESTLISEYGQFDTSVKLATFTDGVSLEGPDYTLTTDTLVYSTDAHVAFISCPTTIVSDESTINSSRGVFNTDTHYAVLLDRSVIDQNKGESIMTGDSIIYDRNQGRMNGFGNVVINNYKDKIDVLGEYVFYDQNIDSAVVTGKALMIEYSQGDSLFMHADTFRLKTFYDEAGDSVVERHVRGFHKVRGYRPDLQMVADSIQFSTKDSTLTLFDDPIIWSKGQQILGEKIICYLNDSTLDWVHVIGQALFVEMLDTTNYNQIAGREMKAFFKDGDIDHADVNGNVLAVFYPEDEDSAFIGMNYTEASMLTAYFEMRAVKRIVIIGQSNGTMYPMDQIDQKFRYLPNFNWFARIRPLDAEDVFYWRGKNVEEKLKKSSSIRGVPMPTLNKNKKK